MIPRDVKVKNGKFPECPGVYLMKDASSEILYVGKAGNLRRRVTSYFTRPHESRIQKLVSVIRKIDYKKTDTAIEALILEAELIKKYQPPFNIREKDGTSFLYIEITTDEEFPRVLTVRGKEKARGIRFGPFTEASSAREALRIVRRIFPYSAHAPAEIRAERRPCFDYQIGLCPGVCAGLVSRKEYMKTIRHIRAFFSGKKKQILLALEKEMKNASKKLEFEKAEKIRRQIFALKHIQDIAFISKSNIEKYAEAQDRKRIEGYDISNISGTSAVGAMVVFSGGSPNKAEYRKFKIKTVTGENDVGMMREVLERRFGNNWPLPDMILVDGGAGQVNAARIVLRRRGLKIPVVGIAKGVDRKRNDIIGALPKDIELETLIRVRDEAHRFAIKYHKTLRGARFFAK